MFGQRNKHTTSKKKERKKNNNIKRSIFSPSRNLNRPEHKAPRHSEGKFTTDLSGLCKNKIQINKIQNENKNVAVIQYLAARPQLCAAKHFNSNVKIQNCVLFLDKRTANPRAIILVRHTSSEEKKTSGTADKITTGINIDSNSFDWQHIIRIVIFEVNGTNLRYCTSFFLAVTQKF